MISVAFFIVFAVAAAIYAMRVPAFIPQTDDERTYRRPKTVRWQYVATIVALIVGGIIVALAQPWSIEKIDVAHIGLKVNLIGDERGVSKYQYRTGWVVYNRYTEEVVEIPSNQQHVEYKPVVVFTKGGFASQIAPSFNYDVVAVHAGDMYVGLRRPLAEVEQTWLYTASVGAMNDVVNKWSVDDIFNRREQFEADVMAEVNKRVSKWFTLSQIRTNITPPQALANAINEKTKAVQEAQQMEAKNRVIQMQNLNKIMAAKGDSAQRVIEALSVAEAIRIKKQEVTPLYIEYMKVSNWDGKNPSTLVTSGSSTAVMVK